MQWFWIYIAVINIIGILAMGIDKEKARKEAWRIPEKVLFLIAILGGSFGCWFGMYGFHHKTKHMKFVIGIPAILLVQAILLWCVAGRV